MSKYEKKWMYSLGVNIYAWMPIPARAVTHLVILKICD